MLPHGHPVQFSKESPQPFSCDPRAPEGSTLSPPELSEPPSASPRNNRAEDNLYNPVPASGLRPVCGILRAFVQPARNPPAPYPPVPAGTRSPTDEMCVPSPPILSQG